MTLGKARPISAEERKKHKLGPVQNVYRTPEKIIAGRSESLFRGTLQKVEIEDLESHLDEIKKIREDIEKFRNDLSETVRERHRQLSDYIESRLA